MQNGSSDLHCTYLVSERAELHVRTGSGASINGRGFQLSREKPRLRRGWQDDQAWEVVVVAWRGNDGGDNDHDDDGGRKESEEPR